MRESAARQLREGPRRECSKPASRERPAQESVAPACWTEEGLVRALPAGERPCPKFGARAPRSPDSPVRLLQRRRLPVAERSGRRSQRHPAAQAQAPTAPGQLVVAPFEGACAWSRGQAPWATAE